MSYESPFSPTGATIKIASSTSSANAAITGLPSYNNSGTILVTNPSSVLVFVSWGATAPTVTAANIPIPAGGSRIFSVANVAFVGALAATGTGDVYFTPGNGGT